MHGPHDNAIHGYRICRSFTVNVLSILYREDKNGYRICRSFTVNYTLVSSHVAGGVIPWQPQGIRYSTLQRRMMRPESYPTSCLEAGPGGYVREYDSASAAANDMLFVLTEGGVIKIQQDIRIWLQYSWEGKYHADSMWLWLGCTDQWAPSHPYNRTHIWKWHLFRDISWHWTLFWHIETGKHDNTFHILLSL